MIGSSLVLQADVLAQVMLMCKYVWLGFLCVLGGIVVVGRVVNITSPFNRTSISNGKWKPIFQTPSIRICQSCQLNYSGQNDTMDLVVARAERRLVLNLSTGTQFLGGRESNSHYHLRLSCLMTANPEFVGDEMIISDDVKTSNSL